MNSWLLSICLSLLVFDANTGNCQETSAAKMPQVLKAGAAISNITPPLGELIVGGWQPFPAKHIHDELFARCLVLDDGNTRLAFVICDNVGIPR